MAEKHPDKFDPPTHNPLERKPVQRRDFLDPKPQEPVYQAWFRALGDLGDDPVRHQTMLAYMSDYALLGTALMPHPFTGMSKNLQSASLDHAIWFHRPFRADEHLLYAIDSPVSDAGRGFSRGSFYTREGVLVASTAQECLMRVNEKT
jgi:acyl-CoA thioesterase-2